MFLVKKNINEQTAKTNLIISITALFWLVAKLMSWRVWTTNRLFPLIPPFEFLDNLPSGYHIIFFIISLCSLAVLVYKPSIKIGALLFISELFSLIADQVRWQPWEYQYLFIILLLLLNRKHLDNFLPGVILIVISIYFYSGLCKLNTGFLQTVWSNTLLRRFFGIINVNSSNKPFLFYAGYCVGLVEIIGAIGLCFKQSKKPAALLLVIVHGFNLLFLGPFGINYNNVIWPWNIAMMGYLYFLFIRWPVSVNNFYQIKKGWNKLVILFWGFLPIFYYFGWWDTWLSSSIYSGDTKEMIICLKNPIGKTLDSFSPYYIADYSNICEGDKMIVITKWAMKELNVPGYPEKRIYLKIKKFFIKKYPLTEARFFINYKNTKEELK